MVLHSTDGSLGVSVAYQREYIKPRDTPTKQNAKNLSQRSEFGTNEEIRTRNVHTIQWYFHSKALSCWALYLRNNVMYTLIAIARFHRASAGRNLLTFSVPVQLLQPLGILTLTSG